MTDMAAGVSEQAGRAVPDAGRAAGLGGSEVAVAEGREGGQGKQPVSDCGCLMSSEGVILQRVRQPGRTRGQRNGSSKGSSRK